MYSAWLSGQIVAYKGLYFVGVVNLVQQIGGKTSVRKCEVESHRIEA